MTGRAISWLTLFVVGVLTVHCSLAQSPSAPELAAIADLQAWAATKLAAGPAGRPLPVAGHWNTGAYTYFLHVLEGMSEGDLKHGVPVGPLDGEWSPAYMVSLIKQGKRVFPSFVDPTNATLEYYRYNDPARFQQFIDRYYRPALEYCRDNNLPIALVGFNWDDMVAAFGPASGPDTAYLLRNGVPTRQIDPFGPVATWQNFGTAWFANPALRAMQEIYPNPPLVLFFNNNEGGSVHETYELGNDADRFNALYPGVTSPAARAVAIREGYATRYAALFAAARAALNPTANPQNTWRANLRFVAYNAWSNAVTGRGNEFPVGDGSDLWFDPAPDQGFRQPLVYDGAIPEYYDNQWQGSKTDFAPWSPQTEALNLAFIQERVFAERPDYYFASIAWEGGVTSQSFNKTNGYATGNYGPEAQRWDAARYQGSHGFGLWALRPRDYREFRGGEQRDGYNQATWDSLLAATETVWNTPALHDYWRFGTLVPNSAAAAVLGGHYFDQNPAWPAWLKNLPRWFLLTSSANPPESTWNRDHNNASATRLRVFALALSRGAAPDRTWLIYAHAPLGAVAGSTVILPGLGSASGTTITLDHVSRSGSYFEVRESDGSVTPLLRGGPAEITLTPSKTRVAAGEAFSVAATLSHPLPTPVTSYTWTTREGSPVVQSALAARTLNLFNPGEHVLAVEGVTATGDRVVGETTVHVGPAPEPDLVYQLSLDQASTWQGLWGARDTTAVPYRLLPNAANPALAVPVHGGAFIDDPERGRVFRLSQPGDGVTLHVNERTTYSADGPRNLAIAFWFRADALTGIQGLFAQGYASADGGAGYSIYLSGDRLYAGSWSLTGRPAAGPDVAAADARWEGNWLATAPGQLEAGRWHQVRLVLRDATDQLTPDKLSLYLDNTLVATGPAVRAKRHWNHPRLGFLGDARLHTGPVNTAHPFRGRLDDFTYATAAPAPLDLTRLVFSANAAGPGLLGQSGVTYQADTGFTGGTVRAVSPTAPIFGPEDAEVYRTARQGGAFGYSIPVANGAYRVVLKFAELDHFGAGQRRFSVAAEGATRLADLDLFALVGYGFGTDRQFTVNVADGVLDLAFTATLGTATVSALQVWSLADEPPGSGFTLFPPTTEPAFSDDATAYELGVRLTALEAGRLTAVRFYKSPGETGAHTARVWSTDGTLLASASFAAETVSGWQQVELPAPFALTVGQTVVVSVNDNPGGGYAYLPGGFNSTLTRGPLRGPVGAGVYNLVPGAFPADVYQNSNYYRDAIFVPDAPTPDAWATWVSQRLVSSPPNQRTPLADPDTDGLNNLFEYALAQDPLSPTASPPLTIAITPSPNNPLEMRLEASFLRARSDVTYIVEASHDLSPDSWQTIATNPGNVGQLVSVFHVLPPAPSIPRRFFRLRITR